MCVCKYHDANLGAANDSFLVNALRIIVHTWCPSLTDELHTIGSFAVISNSLTLAFSSMK